MKLITLKTFENTELTIPVLAASLSKQLAHFQKDNGLIESFIVLIHVIGYSGQLSVYPPYPFNLKALRFLLETENPT